MLNHLQLGNHQDEFSCSELALHLFLRTVHLIFYQQTNQLVIKQKIKSEIFLINFLFVRI